MPDFRTSGLYAFSCQAKSIAHLLSSICYGTIVISSLILLVPLCLAPVVARQVVYVLPLHVSSSFIFPPTFPSSRRFMDGVDQLYMLRWSSNPSLPPTLLVGIKSLLRYAI
jgi:hypothetical protein